MNIVRSVFTPLYHGPDGTSSFILSPLAKTLTRSLRQGCVFTEIDYVFNEMDSSFPWILSHFNAKITYFTETTYIGWSKKPGSQWANQLG